MKTLALAFTLAFTATVTAETLADMAARLVSSGLVIATGTPADSGVAQSVTDATGERLLSEMRLPVTITTDAAGSQRSTSILVLVYDLGRANESAHIADPNTRNFTAPAPSRESMLAGWLAGKSATGYAVTWIGAHDLGVTTGIVVKLTAADGTITRRAVAVIEGAIIELAAE